jgi:phage protein|nr:MAG TPA: hypothetical protein [Caudoviricetes sp.]
MYEINILTLNQYNLLMKGAQLKLLDEEHLIYKQAWLNRVVKTTEMRNRKEVYAYGNFKEFFDYEKEYREITGEIVPTIKDEKLSNLLLKANM